MEVSVFKKDCGWAAPVLGVAVAIKAGRIGCRGRAPNVLTGATGVGIGALSAPFDRGRLLVAALRGVAFSPPDLAFVNIRKGSNAIVPRRWTNDTP